MFSIMMTFLGSVLAHTHLVAAAGRWPSGLFSFGFFRFYSAVFDIFIVFVVFVISSLGLDRP